MINPPGSPYLRRRSRPRSPRTSARATWLGLVPRHTGAGGQVRLLGISTRGDRYLRTLLIHGARSVLTHAKAPPGWALRLAERRPANVVTVALANKTARTIWALLAYDRAYQADFVSRPARPRPTTERRDPTQEVAAERLRKARQGVMTNRSHRDPPSLDGSQGAKPAGEMRRGSADPIRASGRKAPHRRPDTKLQSASPLHRYRSLRPARRPYNQS